MARNFKELRAKMRPEDVREDEAWAGKALASIPLDQLREAREMTQVSLAKALGVPQSNISKIERRADMYLSTLRNFVEAMGGQLELRAIFPEGAVNLELGKD